MVFGALFAVPIVVALGALALAIVFFRKAKASTSPVVLNVLGVLFAVVALGIGSCYAAMFLG